MKTIYAAPVYKTAQRFAPITSIFYATIHDALPDEEEGKKIIETKERGLSHKNELMRVVCRILWVATHIELR